MKPFRCTLHRWATQGKKEGGVLARNTAMNLSLAVCSYQLMRWEVKGRGKVTDFDTSPAFFLGGKKIHGNNGRSGGIGSDWILKRFFCFPLDESLLAGRSRSLCTPEHFMALAAGSASATQRLIRPLFMHTGVRIGFHLNVHVCNYRNGPHSSFNDPAPHASAFSILPLPHYSPTSHERGKIWAHN
jgi:hypothetical protein